MRVAVIGGGIFGCTAAVYLNRAGHEVHLFEAKDSLLRCASGINQFRLHAGYHYPRSPETIAECKRSLRSFRKEYAPAIRGMGRHYYAVARHGSKLGAREYLDALDASNLEYCIASTAGVLNQDEVELAILVREAWLEPSVLRGLVWERLKSVELHFNTQPDNSLRDKFDKIIIAAYAATNDVALALGCAVEPFQFELCEKPVLRLPQEWTSVGVVVMDGEFCSLDPFDNTGCHIMGHVTHAIHATSVGLEPELGELKPYLNAGVIRNPPDTRVNRFLEDGRTFIPALDKAEHVGSMFTMRVVLPEREDTDERLTMVDELDEQVIRIFSGKLGSAVDAANRAVELVGTQTARIAA